MKADVVIVAYGEPDDIDGCLASLGDLGCLASITVVDNGDGRSADRALGLGTRVIRLPQNPGFGVAVNRGVAEGDAECLLVVNPDARLAPGAVAAGIRRLGADSEIAAVQGVVIDATTGEPERSAGRELGLVHLAGRLVHARMLLRLAGVRRVASRVPLLSDHAVRRPESDTVVESLAATAILIRRTAFESVGGFDERFFLYGEDLDLCCRFRRAGWKLLAVPEMWADHRNGASSVSSWDRELRWWQGTLLFTRCQWSAPRRRVAALIGTAAGVLLAARRPNRIGDVKATIGRRR